jgi:FkbM family methyltransferase
MSSRRLKYFLRSKSYRFVKELKDKSHKISNIYWNGKKIYYRTSSSDMTLIYEILLKSKYKSEYFFPMVLKPKVIFDIGGNIGVTSVYLAKKFPNSLIYTFEPVQENFKILQKNIEEYPNIEAFNFGLGSQNGNFKVYLSSDYENFGGTSFFPDEDNNNESYLNCEVKNINDIIEKLSIESIDIIKIDTEGAEYDILSSIQKSILERASWITGELHGNKDFELLNYLESLKFCVGVKKLISNRLFMFHAGKSAIVSKLTGKEIKALK